MKASRHRFPQRGVTLIELMVAVVLGLFVAAGVVTVAISTSNSNKAQTQLARLQEEGRFAITSLSRDLGMANGLYCNNSGGVVQTAVGSVSMDRPRSPLVFARDLIGNKAGATSGALGDVTTVWSGTSGTSKYPVAPTAPYSMPSFLFMRGYDCTLTGCAPVDPVAAGLPSMGMKLGDRVMGSDVVTVRYVNPATGWSIGGTTGSVMATDPATGALSSITLNPRKDEPARKNFVNGDLAMLADCSNTQIFAAAYADTTGLLKISDAENLPGRKVGAPALSAAPKIFDFNRDFQSVTYYLKVVSVANNGQPPFTGALMRRINGGLKPAGQGTQSGASEDELVRGIERLDFRYGVEGVEGNTRFLSAKDVDSSADCPPAEIEALTTTGCLWRGVKSIEVNILMDGQVPLHSLAVSDLAYTYGADDLSKPAGPSAHSIKPGDQGFPDQLLRREFTALVAVRNFNP